MGQDGVWHGSLSNDYEKDKIELNYHRLHRQKLVQALFFLATAPQLLFLSGRVNIYPCITRGRNGIIYYIFEKILVSRGMKRK